MQEQQITKSKKRRYSIIFWLALIIFAYFSVQYLMSEFHYKQAKEKAKSQFSNIETEIYQAPLTGSVVEPANNDKPLDPKEILLKQQLQITELQNSFNALQLDLTKLKTNDGLAKIILNFVKLQDLVESGQNYDSQLQKLEVLCRADFALTNKIEKLKLALQNQPKNSQELTTEFSNLVPQIKAKQIEIESGGSWFGKLKAMIGEVVVIKKTGQNNPDSDVELITLKTHNALKNKQFDKALQNLELTRSDYQEILASFKTDLKNADSFKKISDEIYKYLEALS